MTPFHTIRRVDSFFHLGVGVSMGIGVAFFCACILNESTPASYAGLGRMPLGPITSYALFAPTIYLASFACLAVAWYRQGVLIGIVATLSVCFLLTFPSIISTYYFFKLYYLMAPLMMACAIFGALQVARGASKPFLAGYVATICALVGINVTQLDQRLTNLMPRMNYGVVASYQPFFDIYTWNDSYLRPGSEFDPGTLAVYEQADHFAGNSDRPIAFLGNIEQYYWWIALVRQDYVPGIRPWETATVDEAVQEITVQCDYVVVLTREPFESVGSIESRSAAEKLSSNLEVIWSNDAGHIARITH